MALVPSPVCPTPVRHAPAAWASRVRSSRVTSRRTNCSRTAHDTGRPRLAQQPTLQGQISLPMCQPTTPVESVCRLSTTTSKIIPTTEIDRHSMRPTFVNWALTQAPEPRSLNADQTHAGPKNVSQHGNRTTAKLQLWNLAWPASFSWPAIQAYSSRTGVLRRKTATTSSTGTTKS